MNDRNGMSTTSELHSQYPDEANAPADRLALSLSKADELLEQATMALRRAVEAASKAHAHEVIQEWNPVAHTTPEKVLVSPFTARLTLYSGLLGTLLQELSSIAPISPAKDATNSSKPQESPSSSPQKGEPFSRSSTFQMIGDREPEPPFGSIVMDGDGDAWQRQTEGWNCAHWGSEYRNWSWNRLVGTLTLRLIYRND